MANKERLPVLFLMGPTAAGKTTAACSLADQYPVQLISVDSALVFQHMDIGTAKPSQQQLIDYPHQLLNIRQPHESYCAATFCVDAKKAIEQAHQNNKIPVLVGGTMLYFKALLQGLAPLPSADAKTRQQVQAHTIEKGITSTYQWLSTVDPVTATRLHPNDKQRIERALEVFLTTGQLMSSYYNPAYFQKEWDAHSLKQSKWRILPIALAPTEKQQLHPLIETRFNQMIQDGFLDEMRSLMAMPQMHQSLQSMRCVGYRQAWTYLTNEISFDQFLDQSKAATRQLAKRQMTWLRSWTQLHWIDPLQTSHQQQLKTRFKEFLKL